MASLTPQGFQLCVNSYFTSLSLTCLFSDSQCLESIDPFLRWTRCKIILLSFWSVMVWQCYLSLTIFMGIFGGHNLLLKGHCLCDVCPVFQSQGGSLTLSAAHYGFLTLTFSATPADLLVASIIAEPFWSKYLHTSIGRTRTKQSSLPPTNTLTVWKCPLMNFAQTNIEPTMIWAIKAVGKNGFTPQMHLLIQGVILWGISRKLMYFLLLCVSTFLSVLYLSRSCSIQNNKKTK